ncbi:MAG: hypothetical protein ACO1PZ_02550, partial [Gammaproteobacteria bacterium]
TGAVLRPSPGQALKTAGATEQWFNDHHAGFEQLDPHGYLVSNPARGPTPKPPSTAGQSTESLIALHQLRKLKPPTA